MGAAFCGQLGGVLGHFGGKAGGLFQERSRRGACN